MKRNLDTELRCSDSIYDWQRLDDAARLPLAKGVWRLMTLSMFSFNYPDRADFRERVREELTRIGDAMMAIWQRDHPA